MKKKLILLSLCFTAIIISYGIVEFKIFHKETFLSFPIDCMPKSVETKTVNKKARNLFISTYEKLLGTRCVTW